MVEEEKLTREQSNTKRLFDDYLKELRVRDIQDSVESTDMITEFSKLEDDNRIFNIPSYNVICMPHYHEQFGYIPTYLRQKGKNYYDSDKVRFILDHPYRD